MDSPDLSIIIVSWNCREHLARALAAIRDDRPAPRSEVFVVDNASSDGTVEIVQRGFPWALLMANAENRGFAAANNQALARAAGRHAILLNPDTEVRPGALATLVAYLDSHGEVGAVGPRLVYPDGRLQRSATRFPTMRAAFHHFTAVRWLRFLGPHYRRYKLKDFAFDRTEKVDSLMGAALLVRRSVLDEVGFLDERFWMYYEEVDLCKRIQERGFEIHFYPEATVVHAGGESSSRNERVIRLERFRSLLRYFAKHRSPGAAFLFNLGFKIALLVRLVFEVPLDLAGWAFFVAVRQKERARVRAERFALGADFLRRDLFTLLRTGRSGMLPVPKTIPTNRSK